MKKIYAIFVIGILVLNGLGAVANIGEVILREKSEIKISEPSIEEKDGFIILNIDEATSSLMTEGKPMIPVFSKTFTYPVGTIIKDINVKTERIEMNLDLKIKPCPKLIWVSSENIEVNTNEGFDESVYGSSALYPKTEYTTKKGVGLYSDKRVVFVDVDIFAQYSPKKDIIYIPREIEIEVSYIPNESDIFTADEYDLLIITDEFFKDDLQPLVNHKNSKGIKTILLTTQEIYPKYSGRDEAEEIKLQIKDAIEDWGIQYVLLAGGRKGQTYEWYIPERRSNVDDDSSEKGYSSDLYFSDVYKYDQYGFPVFDDWDSNGNGILAEFATDNLKNQNDYPDYYPDVYVGRIPLRHSWEADVVVNKIITYENTASDSWFKKAAVFGGDTAPPARGDADLGVYEGELETQVTANALGNIGFDVEKYWTSDGSFSTTQDFIDAMNKGAGIMHISGHGNPAVWGNFLPDAPTEDDFVYGFTITDIWKMKNGNKLPVILISGCHNAQFNVSMQQMLLYPSGHPKLNKLEWVPSDTCTWLVFQEGGGAIASIGCSGLGIGWINKACLVGATGYIFYHFSEVYSRQKTDILGEIHSETIVDYINIVFNKLPDQAGHEDVDRKTIEEFTLIGDPTLKMGGYSGDLISEQETVCVNSEENIIENTLIADVPSWEVGQSWKYNLNTVDFHLSEVEGRDIDIHLHSGLLNLKITDETSNSYIASFDTDDLDASADVKFDFYNGADPFSLALAFENAKLNGKIKFDKQSLGIEEINANIALTLDTSSLQIQLPPIIVKLIPKIPIDIAIQAEFSQPFKLIDFPISGESHWGVPAFTVTIDGTAESIYLRILYILNRLAGIIGLDFIPPELQQFLPVIVISDVLDFLGFENTIEIPELVETLRKPTFECSGMKSINVPAGTFNSYEISLGGGLGDMYYSPEKENIVKVVGYLGEFIPVTDNLDLELVG
ncbi:MAG: hypothetical protein JXA91_02650 [Candidatus Thermoplasmatota archaeon]|nr:hypothetical protein [Candidatus Thermoplasmatota archaeon]